MTPDDLDYRDGWSCKGDEEYHRKKDEGEL